ncbi:MAG: TolC family protein [Chitinophagales bacterium]|nr:TolC family protein [Chitinophagales bacterium]
MLKKYVLILVLSAIQVAVWGQQQSENPELRMLIEKTWANYPKIREAELNNRIANERTGIQKASFLPTVNANASYNYVTPIAEATFGNSTFRFQPHDNYNVGLQANGLIYDFGKTRAAINKAVAEFEVGKASLEAMREVLAYQVAQLYYGIIFTRSNIDVLDEQIRSLEANKDLLLVKQRNGDALELDVLNADVALSNAANRKLDLTAQWEKQQVLLASLTGETNNLITLKSFDYQVVVQDLSLGQNADYRVANARLKVARNDSIYFRKFLRPTLTYNGGAGFRNGYQPNIDDMRFNWGIGAGISYPLYVGGKDRRQLRIAALNLAAARASSEAVLRTANAEMEQARADQRAATGKLKTAQTIVDQARAALTIAETRFKNGVATNVDVLTAQSNLEQARLTVISAQYQLCMAGLQLEKVSGRLR